MDRDLQSHQHLGVGAQEDRRVVSGLGAVGEGKLDGIRRLVRAQVRDGCSGLDQGWQVLCHSCSVGPL